MSLPAVEFLILAAAGLAAVAIALRSPFHAFCVFIVTLPFEDALAIRGSMKVTLSYLALLLLAAVCVFHRRRSETWGSLSSPLVPFVLAYLGVAAMSLVMNVVAPPPSVAASTDMLRWRATEYRSVIQFAFLLFSASTFFFVLFFGSVSDRLRRATALFIVVSGLVALYGLYQMVGVWYRLPLVGPYAAGLYEQPASLRPNSTFQEPMLFGHFLLAGMPLLATLFLNRAALPADERRLYGWPALLILGLMSAALMLTISRAAWLGAVASGAVIVALSEGRMRKMALLLAGAAALAGITLFVIAMGSPAIAWDTVANRFSLSASSVGAEQRLWYQSLLFGLVGDYPLLGVGFGNYPLYQLASFQLYGIAGAYGIYWQALVETGVLGFTSLIAMLFMSLRVARRAMARFGAPWRPYLAGWIASITGLFVAHLFMGDRLSLHTWAALGFAMATAYVASQHQAPAPRAGSGFQ